MPLSPPTRRILWRISSLFAVDSLAGGFLTSALIAFFLYQRFGVGLETIAPLFFFARVANALSHIGAAWLAVRIGLVNTMVFTHIPSSLLLVTVAYAPSFPVAAVLFLLREALVEMDVPTRQSYVMALVRPEERALASGVTLLVRVAAWAVAPAFAGLLMVGVSPAVPLVAGRPSRSPTTSRCGGPSATSARPRSGPPPTSKRKTGGRLRYSAGGTDRRGWKRGDSRISGVKGSPRG